MQECPEAFLACLLVWYSQTAGRILDQERAVEISLDGMSVNLLRKLFDAQFHNYWEGNSPLTMLPMTEATFGKIRHGAGKAYIQQDPLLAALSDPTDLFPGGQSIANEPGQGWQYDAHWMLPRVGKLFCEI